MRRLKHKGLDETAFPEHRLGLALRIALLRVPRSVVDIQEQRLHAVIRRDGDHQPKEESSNRIVSKVDKVGLRRHTPDGQPRCDSP